MVKDNKRLHGTFNKQKATVFFNSTLEYLQLNNKTTEEQQDILNKLFTEEKIYATSIEDIKQNIKDILGGTAYAEIEDDIKKKKTEKKVESYGLLIDNYQRNVENFYDEQPFFYDQSGMFWFWKDNKYEAVDDVDVMIKLDDTLGFMGQTVNSKLKSNYLEAFKRVGRKKKPKDAPVKWIQFNDKAISITSGKIYDVTPDYFFTNPIPWDVGTSQDTPIMDKLITEWVGEKYKQTIYELIAYCCYRDYPLHSIFCFVGSGCNGKSKCSDLILKFTGNVNACSTELDTLIDSRFESAKLYKKLVCTLGETNFGVLKKTSLLKKLCGQDLIGYEFKNKKPFDDHNYAKIIISSNSLPTSEDTSDGFYRRWNIINFDNVFKEGVDIIKTIPDIEFNNLAFKVSKILPELLKTGKFTNQGNIKEREERYIMVSNPLSFFIKNHCERGFKYSMRYSELYVEYRKFLYKNKQRKIGYKEFNDVLSLEGLEVMKTSKNINDEWVNGRFIDGIKLVTVVPDVTGFSTLSPIGKLSEKVVTSGTSVTTENPPEETVEDTEIGNDYHLLAIIKEKLPKGYPKYQFIEKYKESVLNRLLEQGDVVESPVGYIKVLE